MLIFSSIPNKETYITPPPIPAIADIPPINIVNKNESISK